MKTKKIAVGFFSAISLVFATTSVCLAGGMNANESSVYAAASGTFQYEGQTYTAAPEYLSQLQAYLCRDDIDLTADQASAAIAEMNANIAQGVAEGYILPTGGGTDSKPAGDGTDTTGGMDSSNQQPVVPDTENGGTQNPDSDKPKEDTADGNKGGKTDTPTEGNANGKTGSPSDGKTNGKTGTTTDGSTDSETGTTADGTGETDTTTESGQQSTDIGKNSKGSSVVTSNGTIYGGVTEKQKNEMEAVLSTRASQDKAKAEITYDKANNQITFETRDGTIYQLPDDIGGKILGGLPRIMQIVGVVLCLITVGCAIGLLASGSMKFQKKKPANSNHKLRKKIRRITGILLSIVLTVDIFGIGGALWAQMSYFDDSKLLDSLSDSGYYHEAYNDMMMDVHAVMKVSGCMEDICDDVLTYENFMFATKNQIQLSLQGKKSSATYEDVKTKVVAELDGIDYFTQDSKEKLGVAVLVIYQSAVKNVVGDVAYKVKSVIGGRLKFTGLCMAVSAIMALFLAIFSERYVHRGIRKIANAFCFAGLLILIAGLWLGFGKPYTGYYIAPDYLYLFFADLVKKSVIVLVGMAVLSFGVGILLHLSAYGSKKRLER